MVLRDLTILTFCYDHRCDHAQQALIIELLNKTLRFFSRVERRKCCSEECVHMFSKVYLGMTSTPATGPTAKQPLGHYAYKCYGDHVACAHAVAFPYPMPQPRHADDVNRGAAA